MDNIFLGCDSANIEKCSSVFARMLRRLPDYVEAVGIGGSYAAGTADKDSDIDIFILVKDEQISDAIHNFPAFAATIDEILLQKGATWIERYGYVFSFLFTNIGNCQFMVNDSGTLDNSPPRGRTRIIYDSTGFFTGFTKKMVNSTWDYSSIFGQAVNKFWLRVLSTVRAIRRGQLWLAHSYLTDLRHQSFIVERLLHKSDPIDYRAPEKCIEEDIGDLISMEYRLTCPSYNSEELIIGLTSMIKRFCYISHQVSKQHNYPYQTKGECVVLGIVKNMLNIFID